MNVAERYKQTLHEKIDELEKSISRTRNAVMTKGTEVATLRAKIGDYYREMQDMDEDYHRLQIELRAARTELCALNDGQSTQPIHLPHPEEE